MKPSSLSFFLMIGLTRKVISRTTVGILVGSFCNGPGARLTVGDFDGNGFDDVLCIDASDNCWVMFDNLLKPNQVCSAQAAIDSARMQTSLKGMWDSSSLSRLLIGDFNLDNMDDLACQFCPAGVLFMLSDKTGQLKGTVLRDNSDWCTLPWHNAYIGDFNGDQRSDVICHDKGSGKVWIEIVDAEKIFALGTTWQKNMGLCTTAGSRILIADFNGDQCDDILCHDTDGNTQIFFAQLAGIKFNGFPNYYFYRTSWCHSYGDFLQTGYINKDLLADLICHNRYGETRILINNPESRFDHSRPVLLMVCPLNATRFLIGNFIDSSSQQLLCAMDPEWRIISDVV